jgi:UDP-N-acetyl-D-mannosaminuronic acid dehydrogenase
MCWPPRSIAPVLKTGDCVILESTSPVGTTEAIRDLIAELRPDLKVPGLTSQTPDLSIAYCPERVLPGRILEELTNNDRSIGGITPRCARKAIAFYKLFVRGQCIPTDARSAEMTKLVENAYRDVNIAFANELSIVADRMGLDVWEVIRLANRHPRVNILQPGPGVGGHCIAVDPWFIVASAPEETPLIRTARGVNDGKIRHVIAKADALIAAHPGARIAALGLAFKANIDDFRESPARLVAATLARTYGERIQIVEPYAPSSPASSRAPAPPRSTSTPRWRIATSCWCWSITTSSAMCRWPSARARSSMTRAASGPTSPSPWWTPTRSVWWAERHNGRAQQALPFIKRSCKTGS